MSIENARKLVHRLKTDKEFRYNFHNTPLDNHDEFIKKHGFDDFSEQDMSSVVNELSTDELEEVAGGGMTSCEYQGVCNSQGCNSNVSCTGKCGSKCANDCGSECQNHKTCYAKGICPVKCGTQSGGGGGGGGGGEDEAEAGG
jgi:predicted ribosomally synthesized peptide with nif11-like leader